MIDVCPKCVGIALGPGELRTFKSIRHTPATRAMDVIDVVSGVDTLASILSSFC